MPNRRKKVDPARALKDALARAKKHPLSFDEIDAFGRLLDHAAYRGEELLGQLKFEKLVDRAIRFYLDYLEHHPGEPAALNNAGVFLANRGDYAAARECFARALAVAPSLLPIHRNLRIADILLRKPIRAWHAIPRTGREVPGYLEAYFDPHAM